MSKFTGPLRVTFYDCATSNLPNLIGQIAYLEEDLTWITDDGFTVVVPKGFVSDGATVPRAMWWFLPPWGDKSTRAAILHDYVRTMISESTPVPGITTWAQADWQLYLALVALGVSRLKARIAWVAVSAFSIYVQHQRNISKR